MSANERQPLSRLREWLLAHRPLFAILLLAPWFGEGVSTSTPGLELLVPWNLAFMVALYGCGALICREVARRWGVGLAGLALLGAAYGVWEEALVDRYWFKPAFWDFMEVGQYSEVGGANVLVATHLTIFHAAISICASVLVVEHLFPETQSQPWVGRTGLIIAGLTLGIAVPFVYGEFESLPATGLLVASALICAGLVLAAFLVPRPTTNTTPVTPHRWRRLLPWGVALCAAAHILLVYAVAQTSLPWPAGVAIAVLPVVAGMLFVRWLATGGPYGKDALLVIIGLLLYHLVLGAGVGLAGRYDMTFAAILTLTGLIWLYRRTPDAQVQPVS